MRIALGRDEKTYVTDVLIAGLILISPLAQR